MTTANKLLLFLLLVVVGSLYLALKDGIGHLGHHHMETEHAD